MAKNKLSAWKAREMLKDKTAHGHPLTKKQKHYFGMVAHGIAKYEEGGDVPNGWLDKYSGGGMVEGQPNFNESSVQIPPNFVGMSNDTSGRNYSPAWNGQFANGGELKKAYNPLDANKDVAFQNWYKENTLEGKNKIPYNENLAYDYYSFYRNNDYKNLDYNIQNHFPDTYKRPSHPTFSNESIYSTPENPGGQWDGEKFNPEGKFKYQTGGNIPGSIGFQYTRIGAPSNGKYAKKTMPSAQDGRTIYYQNGLDWNKVRGMADGGEVNPYTGIGERVIAPYKPVEPDKYDAGVYGLDVFKGKPMQAYAFNQSYWDAQDVTSTQGHIQLKDTRNVAPNERFNYNVDKEAVSNLIKGAQERDIDPYTALAMALQESGINKINPLYDNSQSMDEYDVMKKYAEKYPQGISSKTISDESLDNLAKKIKYAKSLGKTSEADIIQGWNGYGTIPADRPMYGIKGPIDMSKNPVYGKRIIDLRENIIRKNPEIQQIINSSVKRKNPLLAENKMEQGGNVQMKNQLVNLDQLTNFSNYNKKNWLSKYE